MPLSKQPIEVSLGGAVDEGNVEELVQPPRIREAKDCVSLKGGAYTKRDQLLTPGDVDVSTEGAIQVDDGLTTVATTTVRIYPDDPQSDPSESNPAPYTSLEVKAFEPTEADGVKEHGDSATLIIDGVPRTMCMWNVDSTGAYTRAGVADNLNPRVAPTISSSANAAGEWWTYLPVGGVRYAMFDGDRQVGPERSLPTPAYETFLYFNTFEQAVGPPCFPRVRAIETEGNTPFRGFVSAAALSTEVVVANTQPPDSQPGVGPWPAGGLEWDNRFYGARLSTLSNNPRQICSRDIMARCPEPTNSLGTNPVPPYKQPGCVITVYDEDGNIQDSKRWTDNMAEGGVALWPGPPLELVAVAPDEAGPTQYPQFFTLHVDYQQNWDLAAGPPFDAGSDWTNTIRIIRWRYIPGPGITMLDEMYINNPTGGPVLGNEIPPLPFSVFSGQFDWPAGLHDIGNEKLLLVMSSTRTAIVDYSAALSATWGDPFWEGGDMTRLKIGREVNQDMCLPPEMPVQLGDWTNGADAFERRCTGEGNDQTTQMTRGVWAGSFLTDEDEEGRRWLGVQTISDQYNVPRDGGPGSAFPTNEVGDGYAGDSPWELVLTPQTVSGSIVHTLIEIDEEVSFVADSSSCIPGSAIASQGVYIPGIGHTVAIHACATGDDRTGAQEIGKETLADVLSASSFLVTRRDLPIPQGVAAQGQRRNPPRALVTTGWGLGGSVLPSMAYPYSAPYVTAVAIVQALPFGQALGTYMNNPYQVRVNLRIDGDNVLRWTAHQRYAPSEALGAASIDDPFLKPTGSSSRSAPYELYMDLDKNLPQLVTSNGYATVAGAAPMVVGGPQGFVAGFGLQTITDNLLINDGPIHRENYWIEVNKFKSQDIASPSAEADAVIVASYLSVKDENGGEHRAVPFYQNRAFAYTTGLPAEGDNLGGVLYPVPWQLMGIPLGEECNVEFFFGNESEEGIPASSGVFIPPFVSHATPRFGGPLFPYQVAYEPSGSSPPVGFESRYIQPFDWAVRSGPGSGAACYTWSGELAADAPDPSRAVGLGGNRIWSISSVDPRKIQYTKVLRKGYAPEWNQNLSVRVPDTAQELIAVAGLPDGRILFFSPTTIHYTYGSGPSDTGQGSGFAEPAALSTDVGCRERLSVVSGDFGCMFRSDRGFYLVDRKLTLTYVGLPYEDSTSVNTRIMGTAIDSLRSEVLFFTDDSVSDGTARTWVFNTLRGQWSTFVMAQALTVTERNGRPFWIESGPNRLRAYPSEKTAAVEASGEAGSMSLTTGWLPMAKVQGYGRTWEMQITGEREPGPGGFSLSGLKVELLYDYDESSTETYFFNDPAEVGGAQIKLRLRPRKQKSEALSVRFSEYVPPGVPGENCTGWRLDMLTVLIGVKVGLDKVPTTPRDNT